MHELTCQRICSQAIQIWCAGGHEYDGCKLKCCKCGGDHSAANQGCEEQRKAKEIQIYKVPNKVSNTVTAKPGFIVHVYI